jgi:hypothetical protein
MMKALPFYIGIALFLNAGILKAKETSATMPPPKTYYISGVAFDTQTYCADYIRTIETLQQKVRELEAEVQRLQDEARKRISEEKKRRHEKAVQRSKPSHNGTQNKIIISNKPL